MKVKELINTISKALPIGVKEEYGGQYYSWSNNSYNKLSDKKREEIMEKEVSMVDYEDEEILIYYKI